jgi:hypothetical protein
MMFEIILHNNLNYHQNAFTVNAFANKARQLCGDHRVVVDSLNYLELNCPDNMINRHILNLLWQNVEVPVYVKIMITFWWGNLSHKNQAPLFYRKGNLDKMLGFEVDLKKDLATINAIEREDQFEMEFAKLYNNFKYGAGKYKIQGINTAFFTKIFQFGIVFNPQPIIADKWSMRAILADMISEEFNYNQIFKISGDCPKSLKVSFTGSEQSEWGNYFKMINYFKVRCTELQVDPLYLEGVMFGFGNAMLSSDNPRVIAQNILIDRPLL